MVPLLVLIQETLLISSLVSNANRPTSNFVLHLKPAFISNHVLPLHILGARMFYNTQDILWRRKLEEQADLQQALELQSRRLMGLQLLDVKKQHHHRALSTGSPIPSPTHSPNLFNQSVAFPPLQSSKEVPQGTCISLFINKTVYHLFNVKLKSILWFWNILLQRIALPQCQQLLWLLHMKSRHQMLLLVKNPLKRMAVARRAPMVKTVIYKKGTKPNFFFFFA